MPDLWVPGMEAPLDQFVASIHRKIGTFTEGAGVEQAVVEVELHDGSRYSVASIEPEPGFGFVTISPHLTGDDDDVPEALIVPVASIRRIELRSAEDPPGRLGFSLPS